MDKYIHNTLFREALLNPVGYGYIIRKTTNKPIVDNGTYTEDEIRALGFTKVEEPKQEATEQLDVENKLKQILEAINIPNLSNESKLSTIKEELELIISTIPLYKKQEALIPLDVEKIMNSFKGRDIEDEDGMWYVQKSKVYKELSKYGTRKYTREEITSYIINIEGNGITSEGKSFAKGILLGFLTFYGLLAD